LDQAAVCRLPDEITGVVRHHDRGDRRCDLRRVLSGRKYFL